MLKALAPAKINLTLDILGVRTDGYHDVSMLMQTVSLYDTVTVALSDKSGIAVSCNYPGVPCDDTNIVSKAAKAFFDYTGLSHGITVDIDKQIPCQAGLAGGSADGAAVIVLLNRLLDARLSEKQLLEIGSATGADVPFCIIGGTCLATGTGTTLKKLRCTLRCPVVICKPDIGVSTKEAYSLADKRGNSGFSYTDACLSALYSGDLRSIAASLHNDFEAVLSLDEINRVRSVMGKSRALGSAMSGSGSAVFGIFASDKAAGKCANVLSKEGYCSVFVARTVGKGVQITE